MGNLKHEISKEDGPKIICENFAIAVIPVRVVVGIRVFTCGLQHELGTPQDSTVWAEQLKVRLLSQSFGPRRPQHFNQEPWRKMNPFLESAKTNGII